MEPIQLWYVKGKYNGVDAWWGAFAEKADAEKLARKIGGEVCDRDELQRRLKEERRDGREPERNPV